MQTAVANSKVEVVVKEFAKRLLTQISTGAMLIGIASFFFCVVDECSSNSNFGNQNSKFNFSISCMTPCHASSKTHNSKEKKVRVWKLVQRTNDGHVVVLLSDSAVKYMMDDQNVYWLSAAPKWDVCIYNYKENLGTLRPLIYCIKRSDDIADYGKLHAVSKSPMKFLAHPALKVDYDVSAADPLKEKVEMFYQTGSERSSTFSKLEKIFSTWIPVPTNAQHVLNGITRTANMKGVLLQETHVYSAGRKHIVHATDSCIQCEVPASEFEYPNNFKRSSVNEIMQEQKHARQFSGVLQDLFCDEKKK